MSDNSFDALSCGCEDTIVAAEDTHEIDTEMKIVPADAYRSDRFANHQVAIEGCGDIQVVTANSCGGDQETEYVPVNEHVVTNRGCGQC